MAVADLCLQTSWQESRRSTTYPFTKGSMACRSVAQLLSSLWISSFSHARPYTFMYFLAGYLRADILDSALGCSAGHDPEHCSGAQVLTLDV